MNYHLTKKSSNTKTGPIPVSTTSRESCPNSCPLKTQILDDGTVVPGPCYADSGFHLSMHWDKVTEGERGTDFDTFLSAIEKIPAGQLWRHNQAGDLPGENEEIDAKALFRLVAANGDSKGFTYTHKKKAIDGAGLASVMHANHKGFTVNVSADNMAEVDKYRAMGLPVCVVVAEDSKGELTPAGNKVKICPAQLSDNMDCARCGLCAIADRPHVVGFRAHGTKKNLVQIES